MTNDKETTMAKLTKELQFNTTNKVGTLARVSEAITNGGVNILHIWGCGEGTKGFFGVVTSNHARAKKALKSLGISATEKKVVVDTLSYKTGVLAKMAGKLANA